MTQMKITRAVTGYMHASTDVSRYIVLVGRDKLSARPDRARQLGLELDQFHFTCAVIGGPITGFLV